jgi:dTDP-4-dehydrorhamnose reductase
MRILVLGNGKLGSEIVNQTDWDVLSKQEDNIDIETFDSWCNTLKDYDVVVNCIANTDTYSLDEEKHLQVNYVFVFNLVEFCNLNKITLVHISTDYLYEHSKECASENDEPLYTRTPYLTSKHLADIYINKFSNDYLICRLSHKPKPFPYDKAWYDVYTNADYTPVISSLVIALIEKNARGLFNVGTETKSIYHLAKQTSNPTPIEAPKNIPKNVTMDLTKLNNFLSK